MSGSSSELPAEDLAATLAARRELGAEFEPALVESLAERLEGVIQARVEAHLAEQQRPATPALASVPPQMRVGVALGSTALAIPITAIAGGEAGLAGIIVVWAGVVAVNLAFALGSRLPRR